MRPRSDGATVEVWYCRKRDPFVLGASRDVALATCSSCRLSDYTRPPAELAVEVERRNQELVALNAIVSAVNSSLELQTVLDMGLDKVIEILEVDAGWIAMVGAGLPRSGRSSRRVAPGSPTLCPRSRTARAS